MDISLVNAGLAAGAALAALPVILHLFMRQTPRHVIFPALRLIRERQKRSKKRLRVKNWLLLLARMALLALMALALARPTLNSEASIGDREVPTAIGLVFDTSLSMGYKQRDRTRLDEAKERAYEILKKTPGSSQVYVVDSAEAGLPAPLSPSSARKRIEGLALRAVNRPLNAAVGLAYAAIADSDKPRHEVFVLTDLARTAWDMERKVEGLEKAAKDKAGPKTYVLRLAPRDVQNVAVVEARPPDVVTEGEPVEVRARVQSVGPATSRVAGLWVDGVLKDKKPVELAANGESEVRFPIPKVDTAVPLHQGEVRLSGAPDPLVFDDVRYFSFTIKPAVNVLVVSDLPIDGLFVKSAIDPEPSTAGAGGNRPYRVDRVTTAQFPDQSVNLSKRYRCVFLNNVGELSDNEWGRLSDFVRSGGGLVIGLGGHCVASSYQNGTAEQILPATLEKQVGPKEPTTFGQVTDYSHPLFTRYAKQLDAMLNQTPVSRYWGVAPHEGSRVLLGYADKAPALIERVFKGARTGRVLLWTTPLSRRPEVAGAGASEAWNEFPNPLLGWSFLYLMRQSVTYLTGTTEEGLTFDAGKDVVLPIDPSHRYKNYIVQDPEKKTSDRLSPPGDSDSLVVVAPQQLGNWSVKASGADGSQQVMGFSINSPVSESQFVPLEEADLNALFGGKDKYSLVDNPDRLGEAMKRIRVGHELFPWLMALILLIVSAEGVLANRFYRESGPSSAPVALRGAA